MSAIGLDELVNKLDSYWLRSPFDQNGLIDVLKKVPERKPEWRIEILASDLEWRWREASRASQTALNNSIYSCNDLAELSTTSMFTDHSPERLPRLPKAEHYRHLCREAWETPALRKLLISAEWQARSLYGDAPHVKEFEGYFTDDAEWSRELRNNLADFAPAFLHVEQSSRQANKFQLHASFQLGRRSTGEPPPVAWVAETSRLIIAEKSRVDVSRTQLQFERVASNRFLIQNCSRNVSLRFDGMEVSPSMSALITTPIFLKFGDVTVGVVYQRG